MGRKHYSEEFKEEAVKLVLERKQSCNQVAKTLRVSPATIARWVKKAEETAEPGALTSAERFELKVLRKKVKLLEEEKSFLKKSNRLLRAGDDVKMLYTFISTQKAKKLHSIRLMCRNLDLSRGAYHKWCKTKSRQSLRAQEDVRLRLHIRVAHSESHKTYGSPRVTAELRSEGFSVGRGRVARLMREEGLSGLPKKRYRKTTDSKHDKRIAPNLLARNFATAKPNEVWVGDITYLRVKGGFVYLAVLIDLFSRSVVGWSLESHMRTELCLDALKKAIALRGHVSGRIEHTDRGSQYASDAYNQALEKHGITKSMSRKGDCWDNAVAEAFFASLKRELVDKAWEDLEEIKGILEQRIDVFYNQQRRHINNGQMSPADYENAYYDALKEAA